MKKMKVGLILANNIWFSPYVHIYTRFFDKIGIEYSIVSWNRDGLDNLEGFQYHEPISGPASLSQYTSYINFVKKIIKQEKYDKLIVFGPQVAILLSAFLLRHYKNKYIIDYRDLSIEQNKGFYQIFSLITRYSFANVISSYGFKKCLPPRNYVISHNFDVSVVEKQLKEATDPNFNEDSVINILTIGGIRDFESNIEIVKAFSNQKDFRCDFVGRGIASKQIEDYCRDNGIDNVYFSGYYKKEDEASLINKCTFMNIFYPRKLSHDTAMSNRFYNSLIYKRPMIVTKNTTQGDLVEKYGVGLAIEDCTNIKDDILRFLNRDFKDYTTQCDKLLSSFLEDEMLFKNKIKEFVS